MVYYKKVSLKETLRQQIKNPQWVAWMAEAVMMSTAIKYNRLSDRHASVLGVYVINFLRKNASPEHARNQFLNRQVSPICSPDYNRDHVLKTALNQQCFKKIEQQVGLTSCTLMLVNKPNITAHIERKFYCVDRLDPSTLALLLASIRDLGEGIYPFAVPLSLPKGDLSEKGYVEAINEKVALLHQHVRTEMTCFNESSGIKNLDLIKRCIEKYVFAYVETTWHQHPVFLMSKLLPEIDQKPLFNRVSAYVVSRTGLTLNKTTLAKRYLEAYGVAAGIKQAAGRVPEHYSRHWVYDMHIENMAVFLDHVQAKCQAEETSQQLGLGLHARMVRQVLHGFKQLPLDEACLKAGLIPVLRQSYADMLLASHLFVNARYKIINKSSFDWEVFGGLVYSSQFFEHDLLENDEMSNSFGMQAGSSFSFNQFFLQLIYRAQNYEYKTQVSSNDVSLGNLSLSFGLSF